MLNTKNTKQRHLNTINFNKKNYRDIKLFEISEDLETTKELIEKINENVKELYNMTECWEKQSTLDFQLKSWQNLNKIRGKILRYRNIINEIITEVIEREKNEKSKNYSIRY